MRQLLPLLVLTLSPCLQAQPATDPPFSAADLARARQVTQHHHGGTSQYFLQVERLEQSLDEGERVLQWEAQGWIGGDLNKLWFKTEGERDLKAGHTEEAEAQLLYSRALTPYFDLQTGLRQDFAPGRSRTQLVLGLQGLAPYWFEVDAAAFLSEDGELSARLESEYELRLSQRLLLQPRLEVTVGEADSPKGLRGDGLQETTFGLRLRYELRREFAPYLGLEWWRAHGDSAARRREAGDPTTDQRILLGLRLWY